ncbi:MAG: OmpH family outer membrane protein [Gammaproteobacteria bacterium]|jgi:outer membrane protein|nr:OmpH family outer membrane protein [Gammaproteobacteria bacterium]
MSKLNLILGLVIAASVALSSNVAAADYKIGVVQAVRVLESAPQADAAKKKLETEFAGKDKSLVSKQKELKALEDRAAKDSAIMSESERARLERDVMNMRRELKRDSDEFRDDVNFRRNEEFAKIQKMIVEAIQSIAAEQKYDLVLGEGVIFASKAVDITDLVIDRLKKSAK